MSVPPSEPATSFEAPPALSERHEEALERFVLFWGEMASNWGINRTMAQIHALLYTSEVPLDTDQIMARLQISRGNANMNLRSLMNWNLVRKVHQAGSRKDYYWAEKDVWHITAQILKERERRELEPVKQQLEDCRAVLLGDAEDGEALGEDEQQFCKRIDNLIQLMHVFEGFSQTFLPFIMQQDAETIKELVKLARTLIEEDDEDSNPAG